MNIQSLKILGIFFFRLSDELLASQESFAGRSHLLRKEIKNAMEINSWIYDTSQKPAHVWNKGLIDDYVKVKLFLIAEKLTGILNRICR